MITEIVGGIVAGIILATLAWLWAWTGVPIHWLRSEMAAASKAEVADGSSQVQVLREQVIEVAREQGVVLPARTDGGRNPTVVTFSDGGRSFFFTDFSVYQRNMQAGRVPPQRSFPRAAPVPVSAWAKEQLETWLSEHAG